MNRISTKLPVLHENQPIKIRKWCAYVLAQPREQARELAQPLYDVMATVQEAELLAIGQVLQYIAHGERPVSV